MAGRLSDREKRVLEARLRLRPELREALEAVLTDPSTRVVEGSAGPQSNALQLTILTRAPEAIALSEALGQGNVNGTLVAFHGNELCRILLGVSGFAY